MDDDDDNPRFDSVFLWSNVLVKIILFFGYFQNF